MNKTLRWVVILALVALLALAAVWAIRYLKAPEAPPTPPAAARPADPVAVARYQFRRLLHPGICADVDVFEAGHGRAKSRERVPRCEETLPELRRVRRRFDQDRRDVEVPLHQRLDEYAFLDAPIG